MRAEPPSPQRETDSRSQLRHVLGLVLLAPALSFGCSSLSREEQTARLFLDLYLVAADQKAAIGLCSGRARAQLQEELDLLRGLEGRDQIVAELVPDARFEKIYEKQRPGGDVAFLFRVELTRPALTLPPRDFFLLVGSESGELRIKNFSFDPSDSHTSDKP